MLTVQEASRNTATRASPSHAKHHVLSMRLQPRTILIATLPNVPQTRQLLAFLLVCVLLLLLLDGKA